MITQKELKRQFLYCKKTGLFTRKISNNKRFKIGDIVGSENYYGYINVFINGKIYPAHRLAFLYMNGKFPDSQIDHINHIRNDNRWANLRPVSNIENHKNRTKNNNNSSGHSGVSWHKNNCKWQSRISINGKETYLGLFDKKEDAIKTRQNAEIKYKYHKNHGKK